MTRELKDSENDRVGRTTVWRLKYIKQQTDGNRKDKGTIPNTLGKIFHQLYDYCKCNEYWYHASKMHVSESELRDRIVQVRHWQNFRQKRMSVSLMHYPSYLSRLRSWHSDRFYSCGCLREQTFFRETSINSSSEIVESRTRRLLPHPLIFSWCLQEKITYVYKMSNPSTRILVYIYTENHQGSFYK